MPPGDVLDVVTPLVAEHVELGERLIRAPQLFLQQGEEGLVEVDRLVGRAVERADRARRAAASGVRRLREQDHLRLHVARHLGGPVVVEHRRPGLHAAAGLGVRVLGGLALGERRAGLVAAATRAPAEER